MRYESVQQRRPFVGVLNWHVIVEFEAISLIHAKVQKQRKFPRQKELFLVKNYM